MWGWGPLKDISTDLVERSRESIKYEDKEYQAFFQASMKKFGIDSIGDLKGSEKKKFFDYVDRNYKAKNEKD